MREPAVVPELAGQRVGGVEKRHVARGEQGVVAALLDADRAAVDEKEEVLLGVRAPDVGGGGPKGGHR